MAAKCKLCLKSVYPMDGQLNLDGTILHKSCAKCKDCNCQITLSNFAKHETPEELTLLCKTHYFKRFHEQGQVINAIYKYLYNPANVLNVYIYIVPI